MKELFNTICFEYNQKKFNVPMASPWNMYFGDVKEAPSYEEKIDRSLGEPFFVLHLTERCNMACTYCFEGDKGKKDMNMNVINDFILFIKRQKYKKFTIRFFGGEPSLKTDLIEQILLKLSSEFQKDEGYEIHYNLFTNAVYLPDKLIELIKTYKISCLVSLDGCQKMHDRNRIFPNGDGSYHIVLDNVKKLHKLNKNIIIRAVYDTIENDISLIDIVDECSRNGFDFISIVIPWVKSNSELALTQNKMESMKEKVRDYAKECVQRLKRHDFSLLSLHEINRTLIKIIFNQATLYSDACCAGKTGIAVQAEGDLYPCHSFVNIPEFKYGNLKDGIDAHELKGKFDQLNCETIPACKDCAIRYYCGSRCYADAYWFSGDIAKMNPYRCELEKEFFKAAAYIYSEVREDLELILRMRKYALSQFEMTENV